MRRGIKKGVPPVINIDADPDNADWIRILRAERIARQIPRGLEIWETAVEKAGGSRSKAVGVFLALLQSEGFEVSD